MSYKDILFHCDEIEMNRDIVGNIESIRHYAGNLDDENTELEGEIDELREEIRELKDSIEELNDEYEQQRLNLSIHSTGIEYICTEFIDIELMDTINELFFKGLTHRQIIDNLTKTQ